MAIRSKDAAGLTAVVPYQSYSHLHNELLSSPVPEDARDKGIVSLIVQRPDVNERVIVKSAFLSIQDGMEGSGWVKREDRGFIDQICVMGTKAIRVITGCEDKEKWAHAGDQMFFEWDLEKQFLKADDKIQVGKDVILQVTSKPHNGCGKFAARYGADALKVVNEKEGRERRLRGIYFKVVKEGVVNEGDEIVKLT